MNEQRDRTGRLQGLPDTAQQTTHIVSNMAGVTSETSAIPPFKIGQKLGRFELQELLGEGAFGQVYRALDPKLDRVVAIKIAKQSAFAGEPEIQRFFREAQASAQLRHQHIVPVFESGQDGDCYFFVAGFIEGSTLQEALDSGTIFSFRQMASLVSRIAAALHYAHQKGIVHRDIKPANIMLDKDGEPQVMDFGLARRQDDNLLRTRAGTQMGTPAYMSPEQAGGDSHLADARSDVWALGVVMYETMCGCRPFSGSLLEVLHQIREEPAINPRKIDARIPRDLAVICLKCLEKDPNQRYQSAMALAEELERWQRGQPILSRPISAWERVGRWTKRNPVLTGFFVSLVFGVTASAYLAFVAQTEAETARNHASTISQQSQELREINHVLDQTNSELRQTIQDREQAFRQLRRRTGENDLNQGLAECRQGQLERGLLLFARGLENAPSSEKDLIFTLRTNLETWRKKLHLRNWRVNTRLEKYAKVRDLIQSRDGQTLLTILGDEERNFVRLFNSATGQPIGSPLRHEGRILAAAFSMDGNAILTVDSKSFKPPKESSKNDLQPEDRENARILRWDIRTGDQIGEPRICPGPITKAAFDRLAAKVFLRFRESSEREIGQIWDLNNRRPPVRVVGEDIEKLLDVAFLPNGDLIAGHCQWDPMRIGSNRGVRLWDTTTGEIVSNPSAWNWEAAYQALGLRHWRTPSLALVELDRNRNYVVVRDNGTVGTARLLIQDAETRNTLGQPLEGMHAVLQPVRRQCVVLHPRGWMACWHISGSVPEELFQIRPDAQPPSAKELRLWVEISTKMTLSEYSEFYPLDDETIEEKKKELEHLACSPDSE